MGLGRTGCTAAAVTSGLATQKDNNIAWSWLFTNNVCCWNCADYCANFHTFCNITWMIDFVYLTGSQTDLVAVGAVTSCCGGNDLLLWKFTLDGIFKWGQRVSCTGNTHCLIYISTTGQRVTDCTAQTGCCTAEWLNLGWVVVSFVLKL